ADRCGLILDPHRMREADPGLNVRPARFLSIAESVAIKILPVHGASQSDTADDRELAAADFGFISGKKLRAPETHISGSEHNAVVVDNRANGRESVPLLPSQDPEVAPLHFEVSLKDSNDRSEFGAAVLKVSLEFA